MLLKEERKTKMQQELTQNVGGKPQSQKEEDLSNPTAIILSTHLVSGLNETQFLDVSLQSEFKDKCDESVM